MKKLLCILILTPIYLIGQESINLMNVIDLVKSTNIDTEIKSTFDVKLIEQKEVYIPPYNLDAKVYHINDIKIYNGICDAISIYRNNKDFVQLELGFQRYNASLNELNRISSLEFITYGEFYNGKAICVNYLFKYYGYAINVVTLKESQKIGSFYVSSDDVFFISVTTIKYFNSTMSDNYGVKL